MSVGRLKLGVVVVAVLAALVPASAGGESANPPELTVGVVPQRPYGDSDTKGMTAAGVESVRVWLSWAQIEPNRGIFNWSVADATVGANAKAGLTTMPFLFGTPAWAARIDDWPCDGEACLPLAPRSDESRQAFADFAAAVVRRYGPGGAFWRDHRELDPEPIDTWQIWNEPNLSSFYSPAVDPAAYGALVQSAASTIRIVDPDAEILLGGLTGTKSNEKRMSSARFLTELYAVPEIEDAFDGIAVHPYNRKVRGTLDQVETAREIADANGDDAGLWVTELGWASGGKRREGLVKSRSGQARLLEQALELLDLNAEPWDIRAAYWYAWRDTEAGAGVCGWCPWSGLLDRIGNAKPAYTALREFTGND